MAVRGRRQSPAVPNLAGAVLCVVACFTTVYTSHDLISDTPKVTRVLGTGHAAGSSAGGGVPYLWVLLPLAVIGIEATVVDRSRRHPAVGWIVSGSASGTLLGVVIGQYLEAHAADTKFGKIFYAEMGPSFICGAVAVVLLAAAAVLQASRVRNTSVGDLVPAVSEEAP